MKETVHFTIEPDFSSSEVVRKRVKDALLRWLGGGGDSRVDDFCQVVSELVNNAIEHGRCGRIKGELRLEGDKALFSMITDGVLFDPTVKEASMPEFDEKDNLPEGGYGLAIINQLADEFTYQCLEGKNVTVVAKIFC